MSTSHTFGSSTSRISHETWMKIKSGATVAGLTIGMIAICAVSTFACAYAQGFGYSKGTRDGRMGSGSGSAGPDRGYDNTIPLSE